MNSNKLIVINSIILYVRLAVVSVCGLVTTRFALKALGVDDFGLFSVVGGVISFITIFNTIMLSTSNRFIAIAIGKNTSVNETFNVNLLIHILIAFLTLIFSYPIGHWYIHNYINYSGDIHSVLMIYDITILGSILSFVGIPYNGLLLAKENFIVFCSTDIVASITKLLFSYILIYSFHNKLFVYALIISITTAFPTLIFWWYCKRNYNEIIKLRLVRERAKYKEVLMFSIWVGFGAVSTILKSQGAALIVNSFFNTVMNTALGIANSVNSILLTFSNNVHKSIAPQIVKSYAVSDKERYTRLVVLSSKVTYIIMLFISAPFLLFPHDIFELWLGTVPDYVISFTILIIIDTLITSLNAGIPDLVFVSGKIKQYQVILNTTACMSVVVGYLALKIGAPADYLLKSYIVFSVIIFCLRQFLLNKIIKFDNIQLVLGSYVPCILLTMLFIPISLLYKYMPIISFILVSYIYLSLLIFIFGLNNNERKAIFTILLKIRNKKVTK